MYLFISMFCFKHVESVLEKEVLSGLDEKLKLFEEKLFAIIEKKIEEQFAKTIGVNAESIVTELKVI